MALIGNGAQSEFQAMAFHDMLGIYDDCRAMKHARAYANLGATIRQAVRDYIAEVESGAFPTAEHSFPMDEATLRELSLDTAADAPGDERGSPVGAGSHPVRGA